MNSLPKDMITEIISWLNGKDYYACLRTSKLFYSEAKIKETFERKKKEMYEQYLLRIKLENIYISYNSTIHHTYEYGDLLEKIIPSEEEIQLSDFDVLFINPIIHILVYNHIHSSFIVDKCEQCRNYLIRGIIEYCNPHVEIMMCNCKVRINIDNDMGFTFSINTLKYKIESFQIKNKDVYLDPWSSFYDFEIKYRDIFSDDLFFRISKYIGVIGRCIFKKDIIKDEIEYYYDTKKLALRRALNFGREKIYVPHMEIFLQLKQLMQLMPKKQAKYNPRPSRPSCYRHPHNNRKSFGIFQPR